MAAAAALVLLVATLRERRDAVARAFGALLLAFLVWTASRGAAGLGLEPAQRLAGLALVAIGSLLPVVAFSLTRARLDRRTGAALAGAGLGLAGVTLFLPADATAPALATSSFATLGAALGFTILWQRVRAERFDRSPEAMRLRYLTAGHATVVMAMAFDALARVYGLTTVASLIAPLLYLYLGYLHLARVRVADLRQLMGSGLALALLAMGLAVSITGLWLWVGSQPGLFLLNAFVGSFVLLIFVEPLRVGVQRVVDRYFVAGRIELERTFAPLSERLAHAVTLDELIRATLEAVDESERLRASAIFLRDDPQVGFQQVGSLGLRPRRRVNLIRNPGLVSALENDEPLLLEDLERALDRVRKAREGESRERLEQLRHALIELDAQLVLPLCSGSQLLGFWTLSDFRSREPFSSSETALLLGLARKMAVAVANSRTFEGVRARDRLAALGEMAAGLAHEIRNPVAAIRCAISMLDEPGEADMRPLIVEEMERLDRVVGTFLDYAKPTAPTGRIEDLGTFVRDCADAACRARPTAGTRIELDVAEDLPAVAGSRHQLERVVVNVIQNALEALEGRGSLVITVRPRNASGDGAAEGGPQGSAEAVEIAIVDDGPGMDAETLERAFVPFFSTKPQGSGLGLALCERFMKSQGGRIRLDSKPGEGTRVRIELACAVQSAVVEDPVQGEAS